jgi:ubiquinone/menaquinone biosynthesis C-methylase UbiE
MTQSNGYIDIRYLQQTAALLGQVKQHSYGLMRLEAGQKVLDVGCGPGTDTIPLASVVGQTGQVTGIDADAVMVAEARAQAEAAGVNAWVCHEQADATSLPFADATFDACRSERLFQHLREPAQVLAEMLRVTKSGGWIAVIDTDWGTFSLDSDEVQIERQLSAVRVERVLQNGYAGRQLFRLFRQRQLEDISIEMIPVYVTQYAMARHIGGFDLVEHEALQAGIITQDELERWHASLKHADANGMFFASASVMLVGGRKP